MDEYIKREDALKALQSVRDCLADSILKHRHIPDCQKEAFEAIISAAERVINRIPTADVVPKSEVERLQEDVDRLQEINNRQVENIKLAKAEVAREIFDDIKCSILAMSTLSLFSYTDNLEESNAKQKCYKYVSELIDELDKRYTEGE